MYYQVSYTTGDWSRAGWETGCAGSICLGIITPWVEDSEISSTNSLSITDGDSYPQERCFRHRALWLPVNCFRSQHRVQICVALKTPLCYNFPICPVTPEFVQPCSGASTETSCPVLRCCVPRSPVPYGYSPSLNPTHLCRLGTLLSLFHPFHLPKG